MTGQLAASSTQMGQQSDQSGDPWRYELPVEREVTVMMMTDQEFDELLAQARDEIRKRRLSPPPVTDKRDDAYAARARHAEFGACAH